MKTYRAIAASLYSQPHCILPEKLAEIADLIDLKRNGGSLSGLEVQAIVDGRNNPEGELVAASGVSAALSGVPSGGESRYMAVVPIFGTMFQHGGVRMDASGGVSTEQLSRQLEQLDNSPAVSTIMLEVHSPGGQVWGTQELAEVVRGIRDRGQTRIVTLANSQMASAAMWVGTATKKVYVTPGGEIGSLGVVTMHQDVSKAEEQEGLKTTLIAYPERKIEGHPYAPLSDAGREELTADIMATYKTFVKDMGRNRGVTASEAEAKFGGGAMLRAGDAVAAGLADTIATRRQAFEAELKRLQPRGKSNSARINQALLDG